MTEYGLVAEFDKETNEYFFDLWESLREKGMLPEKSNPKLPHITIADYLEIDLEKFKKEMKDFYKDKYCIKVKLKSLGTFINTETLFFSPNLSKELLDFHLEHHNNFRKFECSEESYYLPGNWIPHCTVGSRLGKENIVKVFEHCYNNPPNFTSKIVRIRLIKIDSDNNGSENKVQDIYVQELKNVI